MSRRRALWALGLPVAVLLAAPSLVKAQSGYLDVYIARVKPEKAVEAEALAKKIADVNRRNGGDHVVAMETLYGQSYTYVFVTERQDYADIDKGNDAFMSSMTKALGKQGAEKLLTDWSNCLASSRTELRIRRPDLSFKMPADRQAFAKLVGESRVLRSEALHIRAGHSAEFEALVKDINSHAERVANTQPVLISQVVEGTTHGDTYYVTFLRSSLGGFDKNPTLADILGSEGMAKLDKTLADTLEGSESTIYRFRPELSYPPDEVAQASADFWQPKTLVASAARPKAKAATTETAAAGNSKDKPQH